MKTLFSSVLICFLLFGAVLSHAEAQFITEEIWEYEIPVTTLSSNDALEGFIDRAFGLGGGREITPRDAHLSGLNLRIYDLLKPMIQEVAAGQRTLHHRL